MNKEFKKYIITIPLETKVEKWLIDGPDEDYVRHKMESVFHFRKEFRNPYQGKKNLGILSYGIQFLNEISRKSSCDFTWSIVPYVEPKKRKKLNLRTLTR